MRGTSGGDGGGVDGVEGGGEGGGGGGGGEGGGGGGGERSDPDDQGETQARVSETLSHFIVTSQPPIPLNSKMTGQTRYIFHQLSSIQKMFLTQSKAVCISSHSSRGC